MAIYGNGICALTINNNNGFHEISGHGYKMACNPAYGGRIDMLTYLDQPILRATIDTGHPDPLQSACFPLVPFSNRIRNGKFSFENVHYKLDANWDGDQPVIHGQGWVSPWSYEKISEQKMIMSLFADDWWPWPYKAQQIISICKTGVQLDIMITNLSSKNMPAGLGFHPYFHRHSDTRLRCNAAKIWEPMTDGALIPSPHQNIGFGGAGRNVNDLALDHCFENIIGDIIIEHPSEGMTITMKRLSNARHGVIFVPDINGDYLCVEPVSHITGAVGDDTNIDDGNHIDILEPHQSLCLSVRIGAELRVQPT